MNRLARQDTHTDVLVPFADHVAIYGSLFEWFRVLKTSEPSTPSSHAHVIQTLLEYYVCFTGCFQTDIRFRKGKHAHRYLETLQANRHLLPNVISVEEAHVASELRGVLGSVDDRLVGVVTDSVWYRRLMSKSEGNAAYYWGDCREDFAK